MRIYALLCFLMFPVTSWSHDHKAPKNPLPPKEQGKQKNNHHKSNDESPVRGIERNTSGQKLSENEVEQRTLNGTNNNLNQTQMGSAHIQHDINRAL